MVTQQVAVEQMLGCRYVKTGEFSWQRQILDSDGVVRACQPANAMEFRMFRALCGDPVDDPSAVDNA